MTTQMRPLPALDVGDIVPTLPLKRRNGEPFDVHADDESGNIDLLVFAGDPKTGKPAVDALAARRDDLDALGVRVRIVLSGAAKGEFPFAVLSDPDGTASRLAGLTVALGKVTGGGPVLLLVGPNQHLAARIGPQDGNPAEAVLAVVRPMVERRRAGLVPVMHPPVLVVPDVFNDADCKRLINIFAMQGNEFVEPGHNQLQGRTTDCKMRIPDYGRDDRIDHWVCSQETNNIIDARIGPRLIPEIQRAFNYRVTRHERYRIARYEGAQKGSKHGHRDNTQPVVAHRRFAVTINLNSDEYEGAEIRFPEFSEAIYKPPAGSAIVFSCSLLHEVMPMRSGRRFALLAFLFGET
ncbi:2OG-Fe(II) oxygenase [Thalassobaculum sp. OXR-137]|uniref:2OG-Fe(II) oxygenase n=1 Tax=Thalassobaculum sp. OXR-137 TaxID=3100173 RepID=UPI002AC949D5|nr:2OG-Fe(II) oxygenase [Thalassobaculum sp. OXR-137]WPZ35741.1 2OG-Fe(II) oxygenase [Thalassobaculum sp. OXR-137]